jgi:hypothetical protein
MLKKILLIAGIILGTIIVILTVFYIILVIFYGQEKAEEFEVNKPPIDIKMLVAYQGSAYKNTLVENLLNQLKDESIYIKLIDVDGLENIRLSDWDCVVIINTCERGTMNDSVKSFLKRADSLDRIILHTTSGGGVWKTKDFNIDTITGASDLEDIDKVTDDILKRIITILK